MEVIDFLREHWLEIVAALTSIFMGLKVLSTFTPNKSDDQFVQGVLDLLNKIVLNVKEDKNAE